MGYMNIPHLRRKIGCIALLLIVRLFPQAAASLAGEVTILDLAGVIVNTALDIFLVAALYHALRPEKAYGGLQTIGVIQRIRFVIACVLFGLAALVCLMYFLLLMSGRMETQETQIVLVFMLVPTAVLFSRMMFFLKSANLASQLRRDTWAPSQGPETWALVCAAASLVYMATVLLARYAVPAAPEVSGGSAEQRLVTALSDTVSQRNGGFGDVLQRYVSPLINCALYFAVYRLLYALRLSAPAPEQAEGKG